MCTHVRVRVESVPCTVQVKSEVRIIVHSVTGISICGLRCTRTRARAARLGSCPSWEGFVSFSLSEYSERVQ